MTGLSAKLGERSWNLGDGRRGLLVLVALFAVVYPVLDGNVARVDIVTNALIFVLLALGLNIMMGYAGLLCLGYAAFFAVGGYGYGILSSNQFHPPWSPLFEPLAALGQVSRLPATDVRPELVQFHFNFWLFLPVAALLAALLGIVIGAPAIRVRGDYLAIVTLGFGEMVPVLIRNGQDITGGPMGVTGINTPELFGYQFGLSPVPYYYLMLVLVVLSILACYRLQDSRIGRAWRALKQDEEAAVCAGVDQSHLKLLAFSLGAALGGVGGVVYVSKLTTAAPEAFSFNVSVLLVVMVILGGAGTVLGVVLSAVFISLLQSLVLPSLSDGVQSVGILTGIQALQSIELVQASALIYGVILVLVIVYRPEGLAPFILRVTSLTRQDVQVEPAPGRRISIPIRDPQVVPSNTPLLRTTGLSKRFGGLRALDSLDLQVQPGEIVGIIGPNGSGKTTLFNVLTGLETASSGRIELAGKEIQDLPPHEIARLGISRTFQTIHLFPNMTVLENMLVGQHALLRTGPVGAVLRTPQTIEEEEVAHDWAIKVLGIFGNRLLPRSHHPASSLSYANRRRLEIARALAAKPRLLLLDEPMAGMNPAETLELMDQLRGLPDVGVTTIIIEHKLQVISELCNRLIALDHGVKIAEGSPDEVRSNEGVLRAYLGTAPATRAAPV